MPLKKILFVAMLFADSAATAQTTSPLQWKRVGPSGSFGYAVDLNSISRPTYPGGKGTALICIVKNDNCSLSSTIKWQFDCRGQFKVAEEGGRGMIDVPPNSAPSEVAAIVCAGDHGVTAPRARYYKSRYFLSGAVLRAAIVCHGNEERGIQTSANLVGAPEFKTFSQAFPHTVEEWMKIGANSFNAIVMEEGVAPACRFALGALRDAEKIVDSDRRTASGKN